MHDHTVCQYDWRHAWSADAGGFPVVDAAMGLLKVPVNRTVVNFGQAAGEQPAIKVLTRIKSPAPAPPAAAPPLCGSGVLE